MVRAEHLPWAVSGFAALRAHERTWLRAASWASCGSLGVGWGGENQEPTASITKDKIQEKELLETKKVLLQIKSNKNFKIRWESQGNSQKTEQKDKELDMKER